MDLHIEEHQKYRCDVIVPVYQDAAMTLRCLSSVLEFSGPELNRLIVVDDASPEPGLSRSLDEFEAAHPRVKVLRHSVNQGFIAACNTGLAQRQGDALLLNSDTIVTPGWLFELAEVAHLDDRTACASPLTNNATICSVPNFCADSLADLVDAKTVQEACRNLPRSTVVPTAVGFCIYLRAAAIDLVGLLDPVFAPGYNEENDWCMRAQSMGFLARRANRAFVYHMGGGSFGSRKRALNRRNKKILLERHPHYSAQVDSFCWSLDGPLAAHAVRAKIQRKLRVAIDLRHLPPDQVGTNAYAGALVRELAKFSELELSLVVRSKPQASELPGRVVLEHDFDKDCEIIHKPAQVFDPHDAPLLLRTPAHLVISHLDLIAMRAQGLFSNQAVARSYETMTSLMLQAAQSTIAISEHAKSEIVRELGVPDEEVFVTLLGVDKARFQPKTAMGSTPRDGKPYWLSVATDFPHKNLANLIEAYSLARGLWGDGEPPELLLIGNKTSFRGGVYQKIDQMQIPGIVFAGKASSERLVELYQGAIALVFPSVYEGFGLPILEAMAAETPVVAYPLTSIPEVGGKGIVYPEGLSPDALARSMIQVALNQDLRRRSIAEGLFRVEEFTWRRTAERTLEAYEHAVYAPSERSLRARRCACEAVVRWIAHRSHARMGPKLFVKKALRRIKRMAKATD